MQAPPFSGSTDCAAPGLQNPLVRRYGNS